MSAPSIEELRATSYEPPALRMLGTVHELTGGDKLSGRSDGHTLGGAPIKRASSI
jgi:hypothetical protein